MAKEKMEDSSFDEVVRLNCLVNARFAPENNLQQALGVSPKEMKEFDTLSLMLLEEERYDAAADAFLFLATLNPFNVHYWLNMGLAEHRRGNERQALKALGMACILDPESPTPHVYAAECYIHDEDLNHAVDSLKLALSSGVSQEEYRRIRSRIFSLTRSVKKPKK